MRRSKTMKNLVVAEAVKYWVRNSKNKAHNYCHWQETLWVDKISVFWVDTLSVNLQTNCQ